MNFIYINLAFVLYIAGVFYYGQIAQIKADWPLYRCNPMYMYLAADIESNFVYCIQNMQTGFMGYLLQPLTYVTSSVSSMLGDFMGVPDTPENRARFIATIPMGRLSVPKDIANAAVFLASEEASFLTGLELPVDGGRTI